MKKFVILLACAAAFAACSDDQGGGSENNPRKVIAINTEERATVDAANELAFLTFGQINDDGANVAFSPLSAQMALAMTANGATGQTLDEILELISPDGTLATLNSLYGKLYEQLPTADAKTRLTIANSLWLDRDYTAQPDFRTVLSEGYGASLEAFDAGNKKDAAAKVNAWIKNATNGRIENLVNENTVGDVAMIVNALAFKSEWNEKFDKANSKPDTFQNSDGSYGRPVYMNDVQTGAYGEIGTTEFATLLFGNGNFCMTFIMPEYGKSPYAAMDEYLHRNMTNGMEIGQSYDIHLKIPRFEAKSRHDLIPAYRALGIERAFDGRATFNRITDTNMFISAIAHECQVTVDEEGAEAVAATIISGDATAVGPNGQAYFELTRPFAYMISETSSGVILFMGTINKF